MGIQILEVLSNIVISLFSSQLYDGKISILEKKRLEDFQKEITDWAREYIIRHDGTVLTSSDFEIFLSQYNLIENIFSHISESSDGISKGEFIKNQINLFHRAQAHPENNRIDTDDILREFMTCLYDRIDKFFLENLSQNGKYLACKFEKKDAVILEKLNENNKQTNEKFDTVIQYLKNGSKIHDSELVFSIFQKISSGLLTGKVDEVLDIWPLLVGKSNDLENGIAYLLNLFSEKTPIYVNFYDIQNNVEDNRIYEYVCRISIYVNMWRNNNNEIKKVSNRISELGHIAQSLLDKRQEDFYVLEKSERKDMPNYTYNILNNYPTEQWLVNRICLLNISNSSFIRTSDIIKQLIEVPDNIIDEIIILRSEILEACSATNHDLAEKVYNDVYRLIEITNYISKDIKIAIFEILLRSALMISIKKAKEASKIVPDDIKKAKGIELLLLQVKLEIGTLDFDELIKVCMKHEEYWLFNNYVIKNINKDSLEMKKLIEKYRFVIDLDPSIFLIYVQLVKKYDGHDNAVELLNEHKQSYGEILEFLIESLRIEFDEKKLDSIVMEYKNGNLKCIFSDGLLELIKVMCHYKKYKNILEIIDKKEIMGNITNELLKYKAIALYNTNHEIESLSVFTKLFEDGNHSEEIVYYILALSCNNRREVPFEVLMCAEQSENPQILMLAANVFVIENNVEKAFKMNLKAMLRTTDYQSEAFNQYIGIEISKNQFEKTIINVTDIDTVVQLLDLNDETKKSTYAIHSLNLLPEEPYVWGNATHIYKETAIMYGLLRKKKGDTVVIDSHSYKIEEILPLKVYFFRFSMEKVVANGKAKMLSVPTTENDRIDVQKFVQVLKEEIGDNENQYVWLEQYMDLNKLPVPFFFCKNFVRATYFQLVSLMLVDKTILYRESVDNIPQQYGNYIFLYAALVILYKLGWSYSSDKSKYAIPSTMKKEIFAEVEEIIRENTKDHVTFMEVRNEQLYFVESTENEKDQSMKEAVEFKRYSEKYTTLDNDSDLHLDNDSHSIIKEMLGISDYDSIIIAKNNGRILVTAEEIVSRICHMPEINVPTNGIANFLAKETNDIDKLLMYVRKMVEYKCTVPFTIHTINRILDFFEEANQEEKKSIIEQWSEILQLPIEDEQYKSVMIACIQNCLAYLNSEEDRLTPIGKSLLFFWLKYTRQKILVNRNENGEFITQIVKEE